MGNVRNTMDRSTDRTVDREPRRQSGSHGKHRQVTLTKRSSTSRSPTGTKTKKKGYFFESKSRGSKKLAKIIGKWMEIYWDWTWFVVYYGNGIGLEIARGSNWSVVRLLGLQFGSLYSNWYTPHTAHCVVYHHSPLSFSHWVPIPQSPLTNLFVNWL